MAKRDDKDLDPGTSSGGSDRRPSGSEEFPPAEHFLSSVEGELEDELLHRSARKGKVELVEVESPDIDVPMLRDGVITFLVGVPGSRIVERVREAADAGDAELLRLLDAAIDQGWTRTLGPERIDTRVESIEEVPALVDLRYGSKSLARGMMTLPTLEVAELSVLWNGCEIDRDQLTYVEHVRDPELPESEVVAVYARPELSELEEAISEAVPPDLREVNLGAPSVAYTPVVTRVVTRQVARRAAPVARQAWRAATPRAAKFADAFAKEAGKRAAQATAVTTVWEWVQGDEQDQQQDQQQDVQEQVADQQDQDQQDQQDQQEQDQQEQDQQLQDQQDQQDQDQQDQQDQDQNGGLIPRAHDMDAYYENVAGRRGPPGPSLLRKLQASDFEQLDSTASARKLLRLRKELVRQGLP